MSRYATASFVAIVSLFHTTNVVAGTMWVSPAEITELLRQGGAWKAVLTEARQPAAPPDLTDHDDPTNVRILAKALVFAATGAGFYLRDVESAIATIANQGAYDGRALALGRELAAYVIAADLVDLATHDPQLDARFRVKLAELQTAHLSDGPSDLIRCHERRPNNWGTHCGATRIAIAIHLGDSTDLERAAQVFKGWLGDRSAYSNFKYGDRSWQADRTKPVGINPRGAVIDGHNVDGVLPDDQRRSGPFQWPPETEPYVYEALQGALAQAILLSRAGYDVWSWEDRALLRAFEWLFTNHFVGDRRFTPRGDDHWQPHVINYFYATNLPARVPASPGKNVGWTDWTLRPRGNRLSSRSSTW